VLLGKERRTAGTDAERSLPSDWARGEYVRDVIPYYQIGWEGRPAGRLQLAPDRRVPAARQSRLAAACRAAAPGPFWILSDMRASMGEDWAARIDRDLGDRRRSTARGNAALVTSWYEAVRVAAGCQAWLP